MSQQYRLPVGVFSHPVVQVDVPHALGPALEPPIIG
jgi:hypothetical protein